ncbi:MAG: DUF3848 domain-containing protein [Clostridium sp.]
MDEMNREELKVKVEAEYNVFIEELREKEAKVIIDSAYEIITKEDIVSIITNQDIEEETLKILSNEKYPLNYIYNLWMKSDESQYELVKEFIELNIC